MAGISDKALKTNYAENRYRFGGKELQHQEFSDGTGLEAYDFGARIQDPQLGRWFSIDRMSDSMRRWSPYSYAFDNPIKFTDRDGMVPGPGDLFKTPDAAAKDWGNTYNGTSIKDNREYASTIYTVVKDGETYYTYTKAAKGDEAGSDPSPAPAGSKAVADIHSHGAYEKEYDNNNFSGQDKTDNKSTGLTGYLTTPNGSFQKYDPKSDKTTTISNDLPSDRNDPDRKNTIPVLEPAALPKIEPLNVAPPKVDAPAPPPPPPPVKPPGSSS